MKYELNTQGFYVGQVLKLAYGRGGEGQWGMAAMKGATCVVDGLSVNFVYVHWLTKGCGQGNGGYHHSQFVPFYIKDKEQLLFSFMGE